MAQRVAMAENSAPRGQSAGPGANGSADRSFKELLIDLSTRFINLPGSEVDGEVGDLLRRVCTFLGIHVAAVFQDLADGSGPWRLTQLYRHPAQAAAVRRTIGEPLPGGDWSLPDPAGQAFPVDLAAGEIWPWAMDRLASGETLVIDSLEDLPQDAAQDLLAFRKLGQTSAALFPLTMEGQALGCVGFSMVGVRRAWDKRVVEDLRLVSLVLANAFARRTSDLAARRGEARGIPQDLAQFKRRERRAAEQAEEIRRLREQLEEEADGPGGVAQAPPAGLDILGDSEPMRQLRARVRQLGPLQVTVLLRGETGSGKNLVAAAIHAESPRRNRPMVVVDCAALPANLAESVLFGRDPGAVASLGPRPGRFERAHGSTLLLDRVDDLSLECQAKLLRVIQTGEFERLGSARTRWADVRILAASRGDLERMVQEGRFRADLFHRLNVFPLELPALREHREDLPALARALAERFARKHGRRTPALPERALQAMREYPWPGNVRELESVIERAVVLSPEGEFHLDGLPGEARPAPGALQAPPGSGATLEAVEREHIQQTLKSVWWRVEGKGGAAERLGLNPSTLRARMRKLGLRRR